MNEKRKAIKIKVEGVLVYIPTVPVGETIEDAMDIDLDAANNDPYDHVMAMLEGTTSDIEFTGEIIEVEVDAEGKIVPEVEE